MFSNSSHNMSSSNIGKLKSLSHSLYNFFSNTNSPIFICFKLSTYSDNNLLNVVFPVPGVPVTNILGLFLLIMGYSTSISSILK